MLAVRVALGNIVKGLSNISSHVATVVEEFFAERVMFGTGPWAVWPLRITTLRRTMDPASTVLPFPKLSVIVAVLAFQRASEPKATADRDSCNSEMFPDGLESPKSPAIVTFSIVHDETSGMLRAKANVSLFG